MNERLRRFWRFLPLVLGLYWLLILTLTHLPPRDLPKTNVNDKVAHITVYFGLAFLLYLTMWTKKLTSIKLAIVVWIIILAYGAFDELTQPMFQRTCDIHDWYADAVGSFIALVFMTLLRSNITL